MHESIRLITYVFGWCLFVIGFDFLVVSRLDYLYITSVERIYAWHGYSFPHVSYLFPLFFLLRRVLLWVKAKRISPPSTFTGWRYAFTAFPVGISFLALIFTFGLAVVIRGSGISGIPMGVVVVSSAFLAFPVILITEILDLRIYANSKS